MVRENLPFTGPRSIHDPESDVNPLALIRMLTSQTGSSPQNLTSQNLPFPTTAYGPVLTGDPDPNQPPSGVFPSGGLIENLLALPQQDVSFSGPPTGMNALLGRLLANSEIDMGPYKWDLTGGIGGGISGSKNVVARQLLKKYERDAGGSGLLTFLTKGKKAPWMEYPSPSRPSAAVRGGPRGSEEIANMFTSGRGMSPEDFVYGTDYDEKVAQIIDNYDFLFGARATEETREAITRVTQAALKERGLPEKIMVYRAGIVADEGATAARPIAVSLRPQVAEEFAEMNLSPARGYWMDRKDVLADIDTLLGKEGFDEAEFLVRGRDLQAIPMNELSDSARETIMKGNNTLKDILLTNYGENSKEYRAFLRNIASPSGK